MNREEIKKIIPHREPMLLVDEAEAIDENTAKAKYIIKGDEWFLQGHFPGKPTVPGVILCEMMAQSCCVLFAGQTEGVTPYFTGLDKVRFKKPVLPGDIVDIECTVTKKRMPFVFAGAKAYVNGKVCAVADFSFALVKGE